MRVTEQQKKNELILNKKKACKINGICDGTYVMRCRSDVL